MRDLREVLIWFLLSDVLMLTSAGTQALANMTSDPMRGALTLQASIFSTLCLVSLVIALSGTALAIFRWRKS